MGLWGRLLKKLPGDLFSPESFLSIKFIVFFIRHVFTPYGIRMYARSRDGDVGEPTVFPCAVPVLDISRDNNRNALFQFNRRLAFLYIPAFASDTDQNLLSSGSVRGMDMPAGPASRLEGHIAEVHFVKKTLQIIAQPGFSQDAGKSG